MGRLREKERRGDERKGGAGQEEEGVILFGGYSEDGRREREYVDTWRKEQEQQQ